MSRLMDRFLLLNLGRRELTYGAGITPLATWFKFLSESGLVQPAITEDTDEGEITGTQYAISDEAETIQLATAGQFQHKLNVDLFVYWLGLLNGNIAQGGTSPAYTQTIKAPGSGLVSPWSFAGIQAHDRTETSSFHQYNGLVVNSCEFTIEDVGPINASADIQGDGSEVDASGTTPPTIASASKGNRVFKKDTTLVLGPNGTESVSSILRRLMVRQTGNIFMDRPIGSGLYVGAPYYPDEGASPALEMEIRLRGRKGDTYWGYWKNKTKLKLDLLIQRDANNSLRLQCNSVRLIGENPLDRDEGGSVLNFGIRAEYVVADASPYIWTGTTGTFQTFLATS